MKRYNRIREVAKMAMIHEELTGMNMIDRINKIPVKNYKPRGRRTKYPVHPVYPCIFL